MNKVYSKCKTEKDLSYFNNSKKISEPINLQIND